MRYPGQWYDGESKLHYNYFRNYDPATGRYVESDPIGLAGGPSTYGYVGAHPLGRVDPRGLDAIDINYKGYPIHTPLGFSAPLGHSGVVSVDRATGRTRYYEFGRYDGEECGVVKSRPVPDLVMGSNQVPTHESLKRLFEFLSKNYGKGKPIDPTYHRNTDFQAANAYAEAFMARHACYDILGNNCKTFANDASTAGSTRDYGLPNSMLSDPHK